jgi:hypothetical protein
MRKNNAKTTYYWFSIFALCFLCFQAVSYYIRPNYSGEGAIISYFLGIAPNFFPAIGIPALFLAQESLARCFCVHTWVEQLLRIWNMVNLLWRHVLFRHFCGQLLFSDSLN